MITKLLQVTDTAIGTAMPVTTRHIYASLQGGQPVVHTGGGNFTPIANDLTGFWSYQRLRGEVSAVRTVLTGNPCDALQVTVPLRIVALLDRDGCIDVAAQVVNALKGSKDGIIQATGAAQVEFERIAWTFDLLSAQEFTPLPAIPTNRTLLVVDVTLIVRGASACMADCTPVDVTCALIAAATLDKIRECLGDRLADLCDVPFEPCTDPLTWTLRDTDGNPLRNGQVDDPCGETLNLEAPDATVTRDGQPFGSVLSGGTIDVPSDCPPPEPCDPLQLSIGGVPFEAYADPCGLEVDIPCEDITEGFNISDCGCVAAQGRYVVFTGTLDTVTEGTSTHVPGTTIYINLAGNRVVYYGGTSTFRWRLYPISGSTVLEPAFYRTDLLTDAGNPWDHVWGVSSGPGAPPTLEPYCPCDPCPPPEPCDPFTLFVNGVEIDSIPDPCGQGSDIPVVDEDLNPVGSWNGSEWVVTCPPPEPCPDLCDLLGEQTDMEGFAEDLADCLPEGKFDELKDEICAPCPTICELIEDIDPEDIGTDVIDCMTVDQKNAANVATVRDLDAQAWIASVEALDGQFLEARVRGAVCDLVIGLKADGIWSKLKAVGMLSVARTLDGALVSLKGPQPDNIGFVGADYNRKTGLVGNGTSKHLFTRRNNNADPQDDQSVGVWLHTALAAGEYPFGAGTTDNGTTQMIRRAAPNQSELAARSQTGTSSVASGTPIPQGTATGYMGVSRTSSANYVVRAGGTNYTVTQASQASLNRAMAIFASTGGTNPFGFTTARLRFYHQGEGVDMALLNTRLTTFFNTVDAIMP